MLSVRSLTRVFGSTTALDDVGFDVRPGRITGFVGANGAGKTTAMRIVMGVLAPTSGEVLWHGEPVTKEQRRSFGYMPEERGLYPKLRVRDQLVFFARLHGAEPGEARRRTDELLEQLDVQHPEGPLEALSLGNQQRVQIAAALVHRPSALVLDEPFSGLDPVSVESLMSLLREQVSRDVPLLFSSHQLELVDRLCDDLVVLADGRVAAAGTVEELRERGPSRYRVVLDGDPDPKLLRELSGPAVLEATGSTALLQLDDADAPGLLATLVQRAPVREFARVRPTLSEIFKEVVR